MSKKWKVFFFVAIFFSICLYGKDFNEIEVKPISNELKPRKPEWRPSIQKRFENGSFEVVVFYATDENGKEFPVKQVHFFENGSPKEETDVTLVDETSLGSKTWKSTIVPHGVSVRFRENGKIERIGHYNQGLLHGPLKVLFPSGKLQHLTSYKEGKPHGKILSYFENGKIASQGAYVEGKLEGDLIRNFETGQRQAVFPYKEGLLQGKFIEWHESGREKAVRFYKDGKLHSSGNQSAVLIYDEEHTLREVQNFKLGKPHGNHIKYDANQQKCYFAPYVEGKIHGVELFFDREGKIQGQGEYVHGKKINKHWKKHANKTMAFLALYNKKGILKEAIREFAENGQKIAEYFVDKEGKLEGHYRRWYKNGQLKINGYYDHGVFDGKQEEYFENGQMAKSGFYSGGIQEGLFQEWHENGKLTFEGSYVKGNKEQEFKQWYPDGTPKLAKSFKNNLFHGDHFEWYENGQMALEAHYHLGKEDGLYRIWNEKGTLLLKQTFVEGIPIGSYISYYPDGKKKEIKYFKEGKKEGKWERFYEDGSPYTIENYKNDRLHGFAKGFYQNNNPAFIRQFKEGKLFGIQKEFFPKTEEKDKKEHICAIYKYDEEGKMHGDQKTLYPSGMTKTLISYDHGTLHGLKAFWDEKGNVLEECKYIHGKLEGRFFQKDAEGRGIVFHYKNNLKEGPHLVYYPKDLTEQKEVKALEAYYQKNRLEGKAKEYDLDGKQISATSYKKGARDGIAHLFHKNGKVALELPFKKDQREGISKQFYPSGQLYKQLLFVNDLKEQEEKTFFEDGSINSIYTYKQGKLHGLAQHWNHRGILIFEAKYKEGKQHGKFCKFFENGKPRLEQYYINGKLEGIKKNWDMQGNLCETLYKNGQKIK